MSTIDLPPNMPRYRSHKVVSALHIIGVHPGRHDGAGPGATLTFDDPAFPDVSVGEEFMHKHDPSEGDYLVAYDDGYVSVSPAKAFEEGYTRIP